MKSVSRSQPKRAAAPRRRAVAPRRAINTAVRRAPRATAAVRRTMSTDAAAAAAAPEVAAAAPEAVEQAAPEAVDEQDVDAAQFKKKLIQRPPFVDLAPGRHPGTIINWKKSHGFLQDNETKQSLFFHISSVPLKGYISFTRGQNIEFEQGSHNGKPVAVHVLPLVQQFEAAKEVPINPEREATNV